MGEQRFVHSFILQDMINVSSFTTVNLPCKGTKSGTKILGFAWVASGEIVLVTNYGIEHFQVSHLFPLLPSL